MRRRRLFSFVLLGLINLAIPSWVYAQPFSRGECEQRIVDHDINEIVQQVFKQKIKSLVSDGIISEEFWSKNSDLEFAICNNRASYDTFVVYGKGMVFDLHMIHYLFAQSRALIMGRYISDGPQQFEVYRDLVQEFVAQKEGLSFGPMDIIKRKVFALGKSEEFWEKTITDSQFKRREQTIFLQALYFLVLHERCHVALNHGIKLNSFSELTKSEKQEKTRLLELEADACAINIINKDEARFRGSPISFYGIMMTIATQAIVYDHPKLRSERSHPSPNIRIEAAKNVVLRFIFDRGAEQQDAYTATIQGTYELFDQLLRDLSLSR